MRNKIWRQCKPSQCQCMPLARRWSQTPITSVFVHLRSLVSNLQMSNDEEIKKTQAGFQSTTRVVSSEYSQRPLTQHNAKSEVLHEHKFASQFGIPHPTIFPHASYFSLLDPQSSIKAQENSFLEQKRV